MEIRCLVLLCTWALLGQFSLAFPEEDSLEEFELDEPEPGGKTQNYFYNKNLSQPL